MKKITVADVRSAFEKTGYEPGQRMWLNGNCASALYALCKADGRITETRTTIEVAEILGMTPTYVHDFNKGWNDDSVCVHTVGFIDGRAATKALLYYDVNANVRDDLQNYLHDLTKLGIESEEQKNYVGMPGVQGLSDTIDSLKHAKFMVESMLKMDDFNNEKCFIDIGFIQGILWTAKICGIKDLEKTGTRTVVS